ncbi:MAG: BolA family protein, partial [Myxococcota bacterium]
LKEALSDAYVEVYDLTGTKDHYKVIVVSAEFAGKLPIKQQRMVYAALKEEMTGPIHALTMETYTPEQWAQKS